MFEIILFLTANSAQHRQCYSPIGELWHSLSSLVRPLGFDLDEKACRRAGLDYHTLGDVSVHDDLDTCLADIGAPRVFVDINKGQRTVFDTAFRPGDAFLFGSETAGLPDTVHARFDKAARLPSRCAPATGLEPCQRRINRDL